MTRNFTVLIFLLMLLCSAFAVHAQRQLLLLNNGHVMQRFNPGDEMYVKIKGNPDRIHSYLNNILDDAIVLHTDTIPFHQIERTFIYESERRNSNGAKLFAAGILLFTIDFANQEWIQKNDYQASSGVSIASGAFIAVGLPLMLIKKKSQIISYKYRFLTVKEGDPLYR